MCYISYKYGHSNNINRFVQLLNQLDPDECRLVNELVKSRLHRDILGSLPLELVLRILQFVDVKTVVLLQRVSFRQYICTKMRLSTNNIKFQVSKRWHTILSSRIVYSTLLNLHIDSLSGKFRDYYDEDLPYVFTRYAKQRTRLERGQPVYKSCAEMDFPFNHDDNARNILFDYYDGKCSWIDAEVGHSAVVFSWRSGETWRFYTRNREPVINVRLSDMVVAIITIRG